jgi:hypothetical protein
MMDREGDTRHFPPPWRVEDNGACFVVCDHNGQALAYVYYDHPQPGDLTWDEARRIAANVAKIPKHMKRSEEPNPYSPFEYLGYATAALASSAIDIGTNNFVRDSVWSDIKSN